MYNFSKIAAFAGLAIAALPASAADSSEEQWWLVLNEHNPQSVHFVDVASMTRSGQTVEVSALVLNRSGHREAKMLNVNCDLMSGGDQAVTNFVCGSEEYRTGNGLILGMVSPEEIAKTLFATQSGIPPVRGFHDA